MKKGLVFLIMIAVGFAALSCVPSLWAQDSYSDFERGLELTDAQKAQIEGIRNKCIGEWRAVRRESMRKRLEMRELSRDPSANSEKIGRLQGEVRELDTAQENIYNQYRWEVSRNLNDKQRERYNSFLNAENRRMRIPHPDHPRRHGR